MAFKMKAGKEGPMYKNYGIGKKSPMPKNSPMQGPGKTYAGGDQGERYEGENEVKDQERADAKARSRMIERKYADKTPRERATLYNTTKYSDYGAADEKKHMEDKLSSMRDTHKKQSMDKKKAEFMEKNRAELEADPKRAKYMEQKHKDYMAKLNKKGGVA